MPVGTMQSYSPVVSKDFYVDNLLRGQASLARPVPLSPAVFLKSTEEQNSKRSTDHLKFGVNAILALDSMPSREKLTPTREVYHPRE